MTVYSDTPPSEVQAHRAAVVAYDEHQARIVAYNKASQRAEKVRRELDTAAQRLGDEYRGLKGAQWLLTPADIASERRGGP